MIFRPSLLGVWAGGGGVSLADAILLYRFDEGSGDDVINHGSLAPDGTVDAGTITWSALGGIISGTAGTDAITVQNLTAGAIFAAFKLPAAGTADMGLFADAGNDMDLILRSYPGVMSFKFGDSYATASFGQPNDDEWHILEGTYDGTTIKFRIDGFPLKETAAASKTATLQNVVLGALNNGSGITTATIGHLAVFDTSPNDHDSAAIRAGIQSTMETRGAVFPSVKHGVIIEGDSISANGNIQRIAVWGNTTPYARNFAVGGSSIEVDLGSGNATMRERIEAVAAAVNACDRASLFLMIGANDLTTIGTAAYMTQLESYCDDLRTMVTVPLDIYVKEPTPMSSAPFNVLRATLISLLVAAEGTFFDVLIRTSLDTVMGSDAAGSDTDLFYDGTHPTDLVLDRLARNDLAAWQRHNDAAFALSDYAPAQWFDAQAANGVLDATFGSISNGEAVGRWVDLTTGTAHNAEKSGSEPAPVYAAAGLNGHPSLHFNAAGVVLGHGYAPPSSKTATLFVVASVTGGQASDRAMYGTDGAFTADGIRVFSRAGGNNWGVLTAGFGWATGPDIQAAGLSILCVARDAGPGHLWTNGTRNVAFDGTYNSGTGNIGGDLAQTTIGHYGEIAYIEDTLTSEEIKRCMAGLLAKWS